MAMLKGTARDRLLAIAVLWAVSLVWGTSFVAIKIAAERFDAVAIAAVRVGIAAACLVLFCFLKRETFYPKAGLLIRLVSIAIFGQIVPFVCLGIGGALASSGGLAVMMGFAPLATLLIGRLCVSGENWTTTKWIALLVGFSGLSLSVNGSISEWWTILETPTAELQGRLYALVAAVGYAFGAVMAKRVSGDIPPLATCAFTMLVSTAILGSVGIATGASIDSGDERTWIALVCLGVVNTAVAYGLYYRLIAFAGATFASLNNYLVPLVGLLPFRHIAVLPLGERAGVEGARRNRAPAVTAQ